MTAAAIKASVIFISFVITFISERLWPADGRAVEATRLGRNLGLGFVNFLLGPVLILPITIYANAHSLGLRPMWWNGVLDLLVLDLWIYFWHRLNHIIPFLWRFHEVHHRDEMLDSTSALRFHFGEVVLSAVVRGVVIGAFSMPVSSVLMFETVVVLVAIFHHSNLRLPAAAEIMLSRVIVTPQIHWVHHHAVREDTDSNYATVLSLWDYLFLSHSKNKRVDGMKMGVERLRDLPIVDLLLRPFQKSS